MSIWDQVVAIYGEQTTIALAALEVVSGLLVFAAIVAAIVDDTRRRAQKVVDERNERVAQARRARGLS